MPEHIDKSKNLTWSEIRNSFVILIASGLFCLCLEWVFWGRVGYAPTIWVILSMIIIFGPWVLARSERLRKKKRWKNIAEFGEKVWYFPNLWYVVFLVGAYVAVIDVAQRVIGKPPALLDVSILLIGARNLVLAAFLAVVTSVLAHTFWEISESASKIGKGVEQLSTITKNVKNLQLKVSGAISTLGALAELEKYAARVHELTMVAREVASSNTDLGPFRDALLYLSESISCYDKVALLPLFPPNIDTPSEKEDTFPDLIRSIQGDPKHQQHCAYMAVAQGRYLEAEVHERSFPGILLNITSFSYYAQTAERVVKSLKPWPDEFDFYTLMPKSPAGLFRFGNAIDLDEWLQFLIYYHDFQGEGKKEGKGGRWIRYFAYAPTPDHPWREHYGSCFTEINEAFDTGYIKCKKGSEWEPEELTENELILLIQRDIRESYVGEALKQNRPRGGRGTCVVTDCKFKDSSSWLRLEDAICAFHLDESNFCYRCMEGLEDIFDQNNRLTIEGQIKDRKSGKIISGQREIPFPKDLFAVRKASNDETPEDWILLIGLDEKFVTVGEPAVRDGETYRDREPYMSLAFSPVLDLCKMAESGEKNQETACKVRKFLQRIFLPEDKTGVLTHREFRAVYRSA